MMQASTGYNTGTMVPSRAVSVSESTNKPVSLSSFPKVSVLRGMSLVNNRITENASESRRKNLTDWDGIPSTDVLSKIAAIEERLNSASINAVCENGTVTVTLNL